MQYTKPLNQTGDLQTEEKNKKIALLRRVAQAQKIDEFNDDKDILTPVTKELSLEAVLAASPKASLVLLDEDIEWLHLT